MPILSVPEFARVFKISRRHAYEMVKRGVVAHVRLGRTVRVIIPESWTPEQALTEKRNDPDGGRAG